MELGLSLTRMLECVGEALIGVMYGFVYCHSDQISLLSPALPAFRGLQSLAVPSNR